MEQDGTGQSAAPDTDFIATPKALSRSSGKGLLALLGSVPA
ncbi:hypothetical protein B8V81_1742 [Paenibacillus pasadenensis]|uniref:Uncharacterized protein n=1 Tax=Paenibacillus pasadenensis TaxID=217090 RepID=A0A2N5NB18_9BACL|nr:hypothetical protein B8V81_1742 [Paenibacillus pasadenensis]